MLLLLEPHAQRRCPEKQILKNVARGAGAHLTKLKASTRAFKRAIVHFFGICPAYRFATLLVTGEEESAISIAVEAIEDLDEEEFVELEGEVELSVHLPRALYELQEDGRLLLLRATSTGSVPLQQPANKH